ncbi:MAG: NAD(P)-dependent oxidoreductase [Bacteroidota bacterium]|nr:NAD(P)-dependent oxidoreductase [Bacteroidota bacterium]
MKFALIKETKTPPDKRVVLSPEMAQKLQGMYPDVQVVAQSSDIRIFPDQSYKEVGIEVVDDMSDCDVLLGVKEVKIEALVPNKKYFFFSHVIKKQPYNRNLLRAILDKNIELYDHETIVNQNNSRLVGFGYYAGVVGAYNTFRAFGLKYELFNLPKAETLPNQKALIDAVRRHQLPPIKIVLTGGRGKVARGAKDVLDGVKIKEVSEEDFLTKSFDVPVYTKIDIHQYNKRKDGSDFEKYHFYNNPTEYYSDFEKFTKVADVLITGHFYGDNAPIILTREMLKAPDNKIKVVGDVSCDIDGPIACTLRATTIAEPIFGYHPQEHTEVHYTHPAAIVVMAVDNLPCELPRDASEGFGEVFIEHVIPAFFNGDKDQILSKAKITENGKLTPRFAYLQDFVDGK